MQHEILDPIALAEPVRPRNQLFDLSSAHAPQPHQVSPSARWAFTTSGFSSTPKPGLSFRRMNPPSIYGPSSTSSWSIHPPLPVMVSHTIKSRIEAAHWQVAHVLSWLPVL